MLCLLTSTPISRIYIISVYYNYYLSQEPLEEPLGKGGTLRWTRKGAILPSSRVWRRKWADLELVQLPQRPIGSSTFHYQYL